MKPNIPNRFGVQWMLIMGALFTSVITNFGAAIPFSYGTNVDCVITNPGQSVTLSFYALAGDPVVLQGTDGTEDYRSATTRLDVYNPSGQLVASGNSQGMVRLDFTVTNSGVYVVLLSDLEGDSTGTFGVSLQRKVNPGLPTSLQYGQVT